MTQKYVLGFLFNLKRNHVLLIEKLKPDWQKGKLNGIGGKIEEGEFPHEAMRREFYEECGLEYDNWRNVCIMSGNNTDNTGQWICSVFCGFSELIWDAVSKEEEQVCRYSVRGLPTDKCLPNLHWLIPMCLDVEIVDGLYLITNEVRK